MASDKLADFIPEGEDTSAYTADGFQDFVPAPQPQVIQEETPVQEETPQPVVEETPEPIVEPEPVVEPTPEPVVETPTVTIEAPASELPVAPGDPVLVMNEDNTVAQATVTDTPEQPAEPANFPITPVEVDPELDAINDAEHPDQAPEPQPPVLETKPAEVDPELQRLQAEHAEPTMDEVIANAETPLEPLPDLEPLPEDN